MDCAIPVTHLGSDVQIDLDTSVCSDWSSMGLILKLLRKTMLFTVPLRHTVLYLQTRYVSFVEEKRLTSFDFKYFLLHVTLGTLGRKPAHDISLKISVGISCKLCPKEIIYMKRESLLS